MEDEIQILERRDASSRQSDRSGSSHRSVGDIVEALEVNIDKMVGSGARYENIYNEYERRPVVPRLCVGLIIIAALALVFGLIGLSVNWIDEDVAPDNSTDVYPDSNNETDYDENSMHLQTLALP